MKKLLSILGVSVIAISLAVGTTFAQQASPPASGAPAAVQKVDSEKEKTPGAKPGAETKTEKAPAAASVAPAKPGTDVKAEKAAPAATGSSAKVEKTVPAKSGTDADKAAPAKTPASGKGAAVKPGDVKAEKAVAVYRTKGMVHHKKPGRISHHAGVTKTTEMKPGKGSEAKPSADKTLGVTESPKPAAK